MGWPDEARQLLSELASRPGRLALVANGPLTEDVVSRLAEALQELPLSVGRRLTEAEECPKAEAIPGILAVSRLLVDCDILFAPELQLEPLMLLRRVARAGPHIAVWPGEIEGHRARYSQPGRRDYFEDRLIDALVLRPKKTRFPDEMPFAIERIPA